jgi:hypothetical protein
MLEFIRKYSNSPIVKAFLAVLALTFMFCFGLSDIIKKYTGKDYVVKIGNIKISAPAFELEKARKLGMRRGYNGSDDEKAETTKVLHQIIWETIVDLATADMGFLVSDEAVKRYIGSLSMFRDKDGRFSAEMLRYFIQKIGLNEQMFVEFSRKDVKNSLLKAPFYSVSFKGELDCYVNAALEKRTLTLLELKPSSFNPPEAPSTAMLQEFHEKNPELFTAGEKRSFSILEMPLSNLEKNITISEEDKRHYYDTNCDQDSRSYEDSVKEIEIELRQEALRREEDAFIRNVEDIIMSGANLEEVSKNFDLKVVAVDKVELSDEDRKNAALEKGSPGSYRQDALNVAFSTEEGGNSSFMEGIGDSGERVIWMVHVDGIFSSHVEDFSKVSSMVESEWIKDQQHQLAENAAKLIVEQVKSGGNLSSLAARQGYKTITSQPFDRAGKIEEEKEEEKNEKGNGNGNGKDKHEDSKLSGIVSKLHSSAFEMSKTDASYQEVDGAIVVYQVRDVSYPETIDEKDRQHLRTELLREGIDDMYQQLVGYLSKKRYEIKINHEMLMGKNGRSIDFDADML